MDYPSSVRQQYLLTSLKSRYSKMLLASRMDIPLHCGGSGYNEAGEYYVLIGGIRRTKEEYRTIKADLQQKAKEECESYLAEILDRIREIEPTWDPDKENLVKILEQP